MLGRASSHNCSCATYEYIFSPALKTPFYQGFSQGWWLNSATTWRPLVLFIICNNILLLIKLFCF